jgi:hypothetical protein
MPKFAIPSLVLAVALSTATLATATDATGPARQKAQALFKRYVDLEHNFDPAMADLYSDTAMIKVKRVYPNGTTDTGTIPAKEYKARIRKVMPLAQKLRDLSFYTDEHYEQDGSFVRIKVTRYAELYKFSSPLEIVVGPGPKGDWVVLEEDSEQHPKTNQKN